MKKLIQDKLTKLKEKGKRANIKKLIKFFKKRGLIVSKRLLEKRCDNIGLEVKND